MAGTGVGKFSSTASNNTSNLTVNFAENMAPSNVNNAARELMGHMRDMYEQLGDGYFEFGDGDGEYTVTRGDADTITITGTGDITAVYYVGRKIRITDGGGNVVEGVISASSHSSTTQTIDLTGITLASGAPTKVELGIDTAAFGGKIILDDDGDTYIEAPTDDTIDIYVAGAKDFVITANTFTAESGSTIAAQALTATTVVGSSAAQFATAGIGAAKDLGVGLHIKSGDSGADAHATADELVVEGSAHSGITIASGNSSTGTIAFADDGDTLLGRIIYDHANNDLSIGVGGVADRILIESNGSTTISTPDNLDTLTLTSTDADGSSGPNLRMYRNSGSPADGDDLAVIDFEGRNDASQDVVYAQIKSLVTDQTDGTEDGKLEFYHMLGGSLAPSLQLTTAGIVINESSNDIDFRVESNGDTHALFVDAGNNRVGIGTSSPDYPLTVRSMGSPSNDTFINIVGEATDANCGIQFTNSAGTLRGRLSYDTDDNNLQFNVNASERMRILANGNVCIGQTDSQGDTQLLVAYGVADDSAGHYRCTNASYVNIVLKSSTNKSGNSNFNLFKCLSNNEADSEFDVRGDGNVFSDGGTAMGSPADYAEMFEWKDSNTGSEERFGYSVILDGNKIVKATDSDDASKIIGVVSANPAVLGDAACMRWSNKYLRDEWNKSIEEEYTVTEWTETIGSGVDIEHVKHSYATDEIPDGVTAPSDATILTTEKDKYGNDVSIKRRKLNADFDGSKTYIPRIERKEWDAIGMMGKLRLRKGQPTGTNWIKMRDISSDVEEWLVR